MQIDTTQDLMAKDQCSVIVHYVTDAIHERLIAVVQVESSTGEDFLNMLKHTLHSCGIDLKNCIGNFTDGAANMQGCYKSFSALLSAESPGQQ